VRENYKCKTSANSEVDGPETVNFFITSLVNKCAPGMNRTCDTRFRNIKRLCYGVSLYATIAGEGHTIVMQRPLIIAEIHSVGCQIGCQKLDHCL